MSRILRIEALATLTVRESAILEFYGEKEGSSLMKGAVADPEGEEAIRLVHAIVHHRCGALPSTRPLGEGRPQDWLVEYVEEDDEPEGTAS